MSSLLRLGRKQKNSSNPFRIRIFLFLSYSFGIETINTFIHSRSSLENHTRFQTKMGKVYTRFQTKKPKNPIRWDGTYLYNLYKGLPPGSTHEDIYWIHSNTRSFLLALACSRRSDSRARRSVGSELSCTQGKWGRGYETGGESEGMPLNIVNKLLFPPHFPL